jgi:hypothetical protein
LLVDEQLARAVRSESVAAICHWWGVGRSLVHRWRRAMGVSRTNNPGTLRLIRANVELIAASRRGKEWTDEERDRRRQRAIESESALPCSEEELALLSTMPDESLAKRIGKSRDAIMAQRRRQKIAATGRATAGRQKKRKPKGG